MRPAIFIAVILSLSAAAAESGGDLSALIKDAPWKQTPAQLLKTYPVPGFRRNDQSGSELKYIPANKAGLRFLGLSVYEGLFSFKDGVLSRCYLSLFNRGDAGYLDKTDFVRQAAAARQALEQFFKNKGVENSVYLAGNKIVSLVWNGDGCKATLQWSSSGRRQDYQGEFISLYLAPPGDTAQTLKVAAANTGSFADNIKTNADGDKYLEVPMVDQGMKSYCVVAVVERIMKYYGATVSQHVLAEAVQTGSGEGTSLDSMIAAMKRIDVKLGVRFKKIWLDEKLTSYDEVYKMVDHYNRLAKKKGKKKIDNGAWSQRNGSTIMFSPIPAIMEMDAATYIEMRRKERNEYKKFCTAIKDNINAGYPLAWSLILGIIPESGKNPQKGGLHMRLIIGFNEAEKKIIYSDSWGAGHEFKKMSFEEAWAPTTGLFLFKPKK